MATEKDLKFVEFVLEQTKAGKIHWEVTADENKFVVSFKGKYKVTVDRYYDDDDDVYRFWMTLFDDSDRELLKIYAGDSPLVSQLFFLAKRNALNIDTALDEIMGDEAGSSSGAGGQIKDDEIPF
jgi:hypothetical protein